MTDVSLTRSETERRVVGPWRALRNFVGFALRRLAVLATTVVAAVYLTIIIANLGGFVDEIVRSNLEFGLGMAIRGGWMSDATPEEREQAYFDTLAGMEEAAGLNDPFLQRAFRWLGDGLTLDWGQVERPRFYGAATTNVTVSQVILGRLSRTLTIFGTANLLLFITSIAISLALVRRFGGWLDRLFAILSPLSAAPAWVYGVILNVVLLRFFSFSVGGALDSWPADLKPSYIGILLRHLTVPFLAIFISGVFQGVYAWRSFFLVYASEDYVEMARAKGLRGQLVSRRYILRPAMPAVITSFALLMMALWQEVIALEHFFNVAGIGQLLIQALGIYDTPMIVGLVVMFAYLLAVTVFVLDIAYALVDPRIRVGAGERLASAVHGAGRRRRWPPQFRLHRPAFAVRRILLAPPRFVWGAIRGLAAAIVHGLRASAGVLGQLLRVPSAAFGLMIIMLLIGVSFYAVATVPVSEAISLWRGDNQVWARTPRNALPEWSNAFRQKDLPPSITFSDDSPGATRLVEPVSETITKILLTMPFDYPYQTFPQDLVIDISSQYEEKHPHITFTLFTPDEREVRVATFGSRTTTAFYASRDDRLARRLGGPPQVYLLANPASVEGEPEAIPGTYTLQMEALTFEPGSTADVEAVLIGQVYGLAGTDANRRDMMVALLWGAPIALAFGLIAAFATSVGGMVFAALAAWFGGWVDRLVQSLTELTLILPFFPVSLMIFTLYSQRIWAILGVTVALSIFGSNVKLYRATFLQVMKAPYIEAAQAYGARDWRIVSRYLVPRIVAVLIPKMVILVPFYVFLEATLAFLGLSDPLLPTWGKLVVAALSQGVYIDAPHIVLFPLGILFLTGFAFAMVGMALEKFFEPRLQER